MSRPSFDKPGAALWDAMRKALPDGWDYDPREVANIEAACRQADLNAELEAALAADGVAVSGSRGQPTCNPIAAELRQGRLAVLRLLGEVGIPDPEAEKAETAASKRGRHAAEVRWSRRGAQVG